MQGVLLGAVGSLLLVQIYGLLQNQRRRTESSAPRHAALFIAIGSAPAHEPLRQAARDAWLRWRPDDGTVAYRFFSDAPPARDVRSNETNLDWAAVLAEAAHHRDIVLQPLPTGYGTSDRNLYGQRARFQVTWAFENMINGFDYFLRVDDDSFLCLHRLLYELKSAPQQQFFWGRYWCRAGRHRADENFMLFSSDVAKLLGDQSLVGKIIPFDDQVTLGWNFGYWSWIMNLTVFDDQTRIDAQQGYLTDYMHADEPPDLAMLADFCDIFLYAHHVRPPLIRSTYLATRTRLMYPLAKRTRPIETCPLSELSFLPARHSARLPNIRLGLGNA
jgi:hypothetical protein